MSTITAGAPYGCHNKPRPFAGEVTHQAQDGWVDTIDHENAIQTRVPVMVDVVHRFELGCRYDAGTTDPRCAGCAHINQGAV